MSANKYHTLIASLPGIPPLYQNRYAPVNRFKLYQRLRMLDKVDTQVLQLILRLMWWEEQSSEAQLDETVSARIHELDGKLIQVHLLDFIRWQLRLRMVIGALRLRLKNQSLPSMASSWGYHDLHRHLVVNWELPVFGLEYQYPFLPELQDLLQSRESLAAERLLLDQVWEKIGRCSEGHYFDFEAVVFYVLRWHLAARWASYDRGRAMSRFDQMVDAALQNRINVGLVI